MESPGDCGVEEDDVGFLAKHHPHERDTRVEFDEPTHVYTIDHNPSVQYTSCTTFIHSFFGEFDADTVIQKMRRGANWKRSQYFGMTDEEIKSQWETNRVEAARAGTAMHADIERFYNILGQRIAKTDPQPSSLSSSSAEPSGVEKDVDLVENAFFSSYDTFPHYLSDVDVDNFMPDTGADSAEWRYFRRFFQHTRHRLVPFRTEFRVFDEDLRLAGSIDMLFQLPDGTYALYDWKRSKEVKFENRYDHASAPIRHLPDANGYSYSLQLNLYRYILLQRYDIHVSEMALVVLHPNHDDYIRIPVKPMHREIDAMLRDRRTKLVLSLLKRDTDEDRSIECNVKKQRTLIEAHA